MTTMKEVAEKLLHDMMYTGEPTAEEVAVEIDWPVERWWHQCHGVSLAIVKARIYGESRVARGSCRGVGGQHSWVVLGTDCYDPEALIVDPTLWTYDTSVTDKLWMGMADERPHVAHGTGNIWNDYGRPPDPTGDVVPLTVELSDEAKFFLSLAAPNGLDHQGWMVLANAPVGGDWPAREIFEAMEDSGLGFMIPIDVFGMVTDRNPEGLYLP